MLKLSNLGTVTPIKQVGTLAFICFITGLVLSIVDSTHTQFLGTRFYFLEITLCIISLPLILPVTKYLPKLINIYSYLVITFCFPFCLTFMYLNNPGFKIWSLLLVAGSIVLAQCIEPKKLWIVILIGCFLAIITTEINTPNRSEPEDLLILCLCCFALILYFSVFARKIEKEYEEKIHLLENLGGTIAHELRTPLASIRLVSHSIDNSLPSLIDAYEKAKAANLPINHIDQVQLDSLKEAILKFFHICSQANMSIDLLLKNTSQPKKTTTSLCNAKNIITQSIEDYPISENDRKIITCNLIDNFFFIGNENMMRHVFFNLLKNSFYHSKCPTEHKIFITLNKTHPNFAQIRFKDNGTGINPNDLPYIFDQFFSRNNKKGTGLGLHYCKITIEQFGGKIECNSELDKFTEFIISLPQITDSAAIEV